MFVPLAYNIMHSPPPLHRPSWDQVQQKGEKEEIETKDKPFEPVSRPTSQVLQVGRNFGFEMVIPHQDERFGPDTHDLSHGCSPGNRFSWKDHGVVDSGSYSNPTKQTRCWRPTMLLVEKGLKHLALVMGQSFFELLRCSTLTTR